ncbi:hypothetical protein DRJ19_04350 [Candidatus Woesearchaeota archaeon]|nr:MAG: hypothetical protein DRJ19_04350 [Candidatus Woesearchaeota archaeon]
MVKARARIIVKGRVQRGGYRDKVDRVAFDLNISGYVRNLEDGSVEIVCEGEREVIEEFIEKIRIEKYPVRVTGIDVEWGEYKGEFEEFDIIRDEDFAKAVYDRMDAAAEYLSDIYEILRGVDKKQDKMLEKQDKMLEKQDETIKEIREVKKGVDRLNEKMDTVAEKVDAVGEKVDRVGEKVDAVGEKVDRVSEKIDDMREDLGARIDRMSEAVHENVEGVKEAVRSFEGATMSRFDVIDAKYGEFGKEMKALRKDIHEMKEAFLKLVDYIMKT